MKQTTSPQGHGVESRRRLGGAAAAYRQGVGRTIEDAAGTMDDWDRYPASGGGRYRRQLDDLCSRAPETTKQSSFMGSADRRYAGGSGILDGS
ncbi:MAG TPA: hypothetical protein VF550_12655, partial [Polyangia bacterium]